MLTWTAGVRRPDVVWLPAERKTETQIAGPMQTVPPLVVEVLSPGNRKAEIQHKTQAYLNSSVREVVIIARNGKVTYHRRDGAHTESALGLELKLPPDLFA